MFEIKIKTQFIQREIPYFAQLPHFVGKGSEFRVVADIQGGEVFQIANLRRKLRETERENLSVGSKSHVLPRDQLQQETETRRAQELCSLPTQLSHFPMP